jgi:hypothetical protein
MAGSCECGSKGSDSINVGTFLNKLTGRYLLISPSQK